MESVSIFQADLLSAIDSEVAVQSAQDEFNAICGSKIKSAEQAEACASRAERIEALKRQAAEDNAAFTIWSQEWALAVALGVVSIILHLQAKTLASELVGGRDGPGPAAAVVAGAKTTLIAGVAAMKTTVKTTAFGTGGPRQVLGQVPGLQQITEQGLAGAAVSTTTDLTKALFPEAQGDGGGGGGRLVQQPAERQ